MYIIRSGILNTVLTTEQYDEIKRGELNPQDMSSKNDFV